MSNCRANSEWELWWGDELEGWLGEEEGVGAGRHRKGDVKGGVYDRPDGGGTRIRNGRKRGDGVQLARGGVPPSKKCVLGLKGACTWIRMIPQK